MTVVFVLQMYLADHACSAEQAIIRVVFLQGPGAS